MRRSAFAVTAFMLAASAHADDDGPLGTLFAPLRQGGCITMEKLRSVAKVVELTPDQFQFVRAFYMAMPPLSHELPPGDRAFIARGPDGVTAAGIFTAEDQSVCGAFEAPEWMQTIIDQVGRGVAGRRGDPT